MDPEIQEVPLAHDDVVIIDDDTDDQMRHSQEQQEKQEDEQEQQQEQEQQNQPKPHGEEEHQQQSQQQLQPSRDDPLEQLEKALENACETLTTLATNVMHFSYESQDLLFLKVDEFVKDLRDIDTKSKGVNAVIPFEVIEAIDKGRNPEQCTYQMLASCAEANNIARGKLKAMRDFREAMEMALAEPEQKPVEGTQSGELKGGTVEGVSTGNAVTNGF